MYNRRMNIGFLLVIALLVTACGLGALAYNVGLSQGVAQGVTQGVQLGDGTPLRSAPYVAYPHPFGFGFGFGGVILFLLVVVGGIFLVKRFLWGGPMGGRRMRGGFGLWDDGDGDAVAHERSEGRHGP